MRQPLIKLPAEHPESSASTPSATALPEPDAVQPEIMGGPVEEIAQAYLSTTHGDADIALRCAITDALSDLMEAERRARERSRLISRGFVRDAAQRG